MMSNTTLFVRICQKNGPTQFMRCGTMFGRAWKRLVDVDTATRQRLEAEQMLEVVTEETADYNYDDAAAELSVQATEAQALADDAKANANAAAELKVQAEKDAQAAATARTEAEQLQQQAAADAEAANKAANKAAGKGKGR